MKKIFIPGFILILIVPSLLAAAGSYEAGMYISDTGQILKYRIHLPEDLTGETSYPLLLFFHGVGQRGSDNILQLAGSPMDILRITGNIKEPAFIIVPQCPLGVQWVDTPKDSPFHIMDPVPTDPMKLTIELLREISEKYPVDSKRIYAVGFSMGGFAVWDIMQRLPSTFAAAIPVSGGGDENLADELIDIPIWAFHGSSDRVVSPARSRNMINAIFTEGGSPVYTEYKSVGHNVWFRVFSNIKIIQWLFDQEK
jgi:predicted peptidase